MIFFFLLLNCFATSSAKEKKSVFVHDVHVALKKDEYSIVRDAIEADSSYISQKDFRGDTILSLILENESKDKAFLSFKSFILQKANTDDMAIAFSILTNKSTKFDEKLLFELYNIHKSAELFTKLFDLLEDEYRLNLIKSIKEKDEKLLQILEINKDMWPIFKKACNKRNYDKKILRNIKETSESFTEYLQNLSKKLDILIKDHNQKMHTIAGLNEYLPKIKGSVESKLVQVIDWALYFLFSDEIDVSSYNIFEGDGRHNKERAGKILIKRIYTTILKKANSFDIDELYEGDFNLLNNIYDDNKEKLEKIFGKNNIEKKEENKVPALPIKSK